MLDLTPDKTVMSVVLYVYSEKMHVDGSSVSAITLFRAGLKLFGVYVFLKAIPLLIVGLVLYLCTCARIIHACGERQAVSSRIHLRRNWVFAVIPY